MSRDLEIVFYSPDPQRLDEWIACLRAQGLRFEPVRWQAGQPASGARFAIVWLPPEDLFRSETSLQAVFNVGAGVDGILRNPGLPDHVDVVRLEDSGLTAKITEYVIHAIAEINRHMGDYRQANRERHWRPAPYTYAEDWPVGIMGLGVIGRQLAVSLSRLGYPVSGWARSLHDIEGVACHAGEAGLDRFLARTRLLINVLPLTGATENILGQRTFSRLRAGSHLINLGRGEHLDEQALIDSIAGGTLAGAVLDVFRTEPLPGDHPFWNIPAIRITPHISGATNLKLAMEQIAGKIAIYVAGSKPSGVVDRNAGY
jgi:glyoxylate/hydroxypyruvate reductase A